MTAISISIAALCCGCVGEVGEATAEDALELTAVQPAKLSARGGQVTLKGRGLRDGAVVSVGEHAATLVQVLSSGEALVTVPPMMAGRVTLELRNTDGETSSLDDELLVTALALEFVESDPLAEASPEANLSSAVLGDFDLDGDIDVVTGGLGAAGWMATNEGAGSFDVSASAARLEGWPSSTRALAKADFDGDGALDIYAGNAGDSEAARADGLFQNDGKGYFSNVAATALPAGQLDDTSCVASGDLNGDGRPDLVVGNDVADAIPFRIYLNKSDEDGISFEQAPEAFAPKQPWLVSSLALADMDGDGDLDLLVAIASDDNAQWAPWLAQGLVLLTNDGTGKLLPSKPLPSIDTGVSDICTGDVDGDGDEDVVAIMQGGQDQLLFNDGAGEFSNQTITNLPFDFADGSSGVLLDLDMDSDRDLLIATSGGQSRIYLNDGAGYFVDHTLLLPAYPSDLSVFIAAADVDADKDQDLLVFNAVGGPARLYLSAEEGPDEAY